jgi:transcriptional regulator with XRE-family HTH domain
METLHPVRRWRKENGMTLADLAGMLDVTPSHLSEIERGRNGASLKLAARLSEITGVSMEMLAQEAAE